MVYINKNSNSGQGNVFNAERDNNGEGIKVDNLISEFDQESSEG